MTSDRNRITALCLGLAATAVLAGTASAQQRPMSINQWLQAERNNANMERAIREYERARFGTASQQPQQPHRSQPQYRAPQPAYQQSYSPPQQAQTPQAAPQQPVQPQPLTPNPQQPQPYQGQQPVYPQQQYQPSPQPYPYQTQSGGALPQHSNQPNTYQAPPDALEKIDKEYDPTGSGGSPINGFYVDAHLGLPLVPQQAYTDSSSVGGADFSPLGLYVDAALGYKFNDKFSVELEGGYQLVEYDEPRVAGGVSIISVLANGQYTHALRDGSAWYATGGMGLAQHKISDADVSGTSTSFDGSDIVLAYQLGGGFLYPMSTRTSLDLGYRYFGTTGADINSTFGDFTAEYSSHVFMLGIKYQL